jgi:hypothetical protein
MIATDAIPAASPTTLATPPQQAAFSVQTAEKFLNRAIPPKEALVEGLLYRRDLVCFAGRRRHGKTTILSGLAMALTIPKTEFLGYEITAPRRVAVFFLEDDAGELQNKLGRLLKGQEPPARLAVYTRSDFQHEGIPISAEEPRFVKKVQQICIAHKADLVVFDNLAHLIGADYSNSKKIHSLMDLVFRLSSDLNAAVLIAAHPRKRSGEPTGFLNPSAGCSLRNDPEAFFENVMGSSHFVNSCGSLWGIERDTTTNRTDFLGGAQRFTGEESRMVLEQDEDGWMHVIDDVAFNLPIGVNTTPRQKAWGLLPDRFSFLEGERLVAEALKRTGYNNWINLLKRLRLILPEGTGYVKASSGTGGK